MVIFRADGSPPVVSAPHYIVWLAQATRRQYQLAPAFVEGGVATEAHELVLLKKTGPCRNFGCEVRLYSAASTSQRLMTLSGLRRLPAVSTSLPARLSKEGSPLSRMN